MGRADCQQLHRSGLACLALLCLLGCAGHGAQRLTAPLVALPLLSQLDAAGSGTLRRSSDMQHALLADPPVAQSGTGAQWQAGSLSLTPASPTSASWAVFALSGLPPGGSAYPTQLHVTADAPYWPAVADFAAARWTFLPYSAAGSYALTGGAGLVSPDHAAYIALVCYGTPANLTSVQLTTNESPAPDADPLLGVNLEQVGSLSVSWTFLDVFKMSDPFVSTTPGGAANPTPLDLDAQGWVKSLQANQAATAVFLRQQQGYRPAGQYVCLYDGTGTLSAAGDASISSQTPGRIVLDVNPGSNGNRSAIRITATDPADYARNIRIVPLAHEADYAAQVFSPEFLGGLAPFKVLRFLNWNRISNSAVATPADLTAPDFETQAVSNGVAYAYMCQLCNRVGADLWVNIPHLADDACVTQIATTLRDNLDPAHKVYIEHSNEVWSDGFTQGPYCQAQGQALNLSPDPLTARIRFHSQRSVHIFDLFEQAFGGTARLVRVLGAAHHNVFTVSEALDWQNAYQHCDAVCTAPYIGGRLGRDPDAPQAKTMTPAQLIAQMDMDSQTSAGMTAANAASAQAHGVRYIAYEGGQALYAQGAYTSDSQLTGLFSTVNRDSGMRQLYLDHLNRWHDNGGGLFMAFSYVGRYDASGNWGLYEQQAQDAATAYKLQGLLDYAAQFP